MAFRPNCHPILFLLSALFKKGRDTVLFFPAFYLRSLPHFLVLPTIEIHHVVLGIPQFAALASPQFQEAVPVAPAV